jgi:hypothetical protein
LEVFEKWKANLQDRFWDNEITSGAFNDMMDKVNTDMARLQNSLDGLQQEMTPYKKYIKHTIPMLQNIVEYNKKADGVTKNKILCCIFDGKLVLENGRVAATPFSPAVQILLNIAKGFEGSEKRKRSNSTSFLHWLALPDFFKMFLH